MTRNEFILWWKDYAGRFPATACWIRELGRVLGDRDKPDSFDASVPNALLNSWVDVLSDVPLREAMAVTRAMASGDLEPIGTTHADRERTALTVRRAALAAKRAGQIATRHEEPRPDIPSGFVVGRDAEGNAVTLRGLVALCKPLIQSGRTSRQAADEVFRTITWTDSFDFRRDAFRCTLCEDRGTVLVWTSNTVRLAVEQPQRVMTDPLVRRTGSIPCSCDAGAKHVWDRGGSPPPNWRGYTSKWMRYDSSRWCRARSNYPDDDDAAALVEWAGCYAERCREHWEKVRGNGGASCQQTIDF